MRKQTGLRLEPDLEQLLRDAAQANGVLLSQEIRSRLWKSFGGDAAYVRERNAYHEAWANKTNIAP